MGTALPYRHMAARSPSPLAPSQSWWHVRLTLVGQRETNGEATKGGLLAGAGRARSWHLLHSGRVFGSRRIRRVEDRRKGGA
jgi:hypothetical protein